LELSVIVPVFNGANYIKENLSFLEKELGSICSDFEIIVVSDGSKDGTEKKINEIKSRYIKSYHYSKNQGKGFALKYGALKAKGKLIAFLDADMELSPKELFKFLKLMELYDCDIVIGSKRHPQSKVNYPFFRKLQSFLYQSLVFLLFRLNIKDTQTGIKLFKREILDLILPKTLVKKYAFDLELLVIASHFGFKKILEAPIELNYKFASTVTFSSAWKTFIDTLAVYYRLKIKKYYDKTF